jgi:hypothetical protein
MAARQTTPKEHFSSARSHAGRALGASLVSAWLLFWMNAPARAQNPITSPRIAESGAVNAPGTPQTPANPNKEPGIPLAEILRGNGTRFGYTLSKGNILPDTVTLSLNGQRLTSGRDFVLDAVNGTILFLRSISRYDSISVYYRYVEAGTAPRQASPVPGLNFQLGTRSQIGLMFGASAGNGDGLTSTTYGLSLNSRFGSKGAGLYRGLAFFSNLQKSDNIQLGVSQQALDIANAATPETGTDHLLTQSLSFQSGNFRVRADFQDVGKKFSGFQTLRQNFASNAEMLQHIGMLEAERGVKRLGFGAELGLGKKGQAGQSFALDFNQIQDGNGSISRQSAELNLANLRLRYDTRSVSQNFERFAGLREGDKNQWAQERGMTSTTFGLGFKFGMGKKSAPGALDFVSQKFGDTSGALTRNAFRFAAGNFGFQMMQRDAEKGFSRLNNLSVADKTALALDLYQQFDPNAKAEQVTDADRQQVVREVGLKRNALRAGLGSGKTGGLSFSQLSIRDSNLSGDASAEAAFRRNSLAFHTNGLGFSLTRQQAGTRFNRFADLADVERGALVLDIMQAYDPRLQMAQVNPNDKNFITRSAGLSRDLIRGDWSLNKTASLTVAQIGVQEKRGEGDAAQTARFQRTSIALQTPNFDISLTQRKAEANFTRIGDLTEFEKSVLALDIRRQFDPTAALEHISPKERELTPREAGISRSNLRANLRMGKDAKKGGFSFNQVAITAEAPNKNGAKTNASIQRQTAQLITPQMQISLLKQSIAPGFVRLPELNDIERVQFANERGIQKEQISATYQVNRATRIGFSSLQAATIPGSATPAAKQGEEPAPAGLSRQSLTLETKGLSLNANLATTDKTFNRAADLAIPDADKQAIEQERGYRRFDYTARFGLKKGLAVESYHSFARNSVEARGRQVYRHNLLFNPSKRTMLNLMLDGDLTSIASLRNGLAHSLYNIQHDLGRGMHLTWLQDNLEQYAKNEVQGGAKTDFFQFRTAQDKPDRLLIENRRVAFHNGSQEATANLNLHLKPTKEFTVAYSRQDIDRSHAASEKMDAIDFLWQATRQFAVVGGFSQRELSYTPEDSGRGNINTLSVGLSGQPIPNVTLTAKYDEIHHVAQNTKNAADISISNTKPLAFGPVKDLTITARFASQNDQRRLLGETMTGRFAWKMWKNEFLFDYGGFTQQNGSFTNRIYSFTTDPNTKGWFKGSILYKSRTMLDGTEFAIRRFTADARLSKRTHFVYTYGTLPEDERGNIIPQEMIDLSFKHAFRKDILFNFFYRMSDQQVTQMMTRSLGFGFDSRLNANTRLLLNFSVDGNNAPGRYDRSTFFQVNFERRFSAENFFNLSARIRNFTTPGMQDEVQAFMDVRFRF